MLLKNRGGEDVMVVCTDGLSGIKEAISAVFPKAEYQRCIVHMVRNTLRYVPHKDRKSFANDLREIYLTVSEESGLEALARASENAKIGSNSPFGPILTFLRLSNPRSGW